MIILKTTIAIETALYTLSGGILLFLISKTIENTLVIPFQTFVKVKSKVKTLLVFHSNKFGNIESWNNKREEFVKGLTEIREISSEIYSLSCMHKIARVLRIIPSKKNLEKAGRGLMALSNTTKTYNDDYSSIDEIRKEIEISLNLRNKSG